MKEKLKNTCTFRVALEDRDETGYPRSELFYIRAYHDSSRWWNTVFHIHRELMVPALVEEAEQEALKRIQSKIGSNLHIDEFEHAASPADLPPSLTAGIFSAVAKSWEDDSLLSRFESLIFGKQEYLEAGLTLTEVAEKLHTNKTYISRLVNNTYNLAFPDLINTLRQMNYTEFQSPKFHEYEQQLRNHLA